LYPSQREDYQDQNPAGFEVMIRDCFQSPEDADTLTRFDAGFRPYLLAILRRYYPEPSLAEDVYQSAFIKFIDLSILR